MEATWFALIALMLTAYVVLDGFDLGAGIVHRRVASTDDERRTVLAAIGPVWDGNEVWLIASGGVLVFAFPRVYAVAFSGFYLPLMIVLWLLVSARSKRWLVRRAAVRQLLAGRAFGRVRRLHADHRRAGDPAAGGARRDLPGVEDRR